MTVPPDRSLSPMQPVNVPSAYPRELETWVTLLDGSEIFVRPVVPQDEARMVSAMEFGDGETIRKRFLSAAPPNHPKQIRYLVNIDYSWRLALLGMDGSGDSIGIARYESSEGVEAAEVAIVVDPTWRKRGLASRLLRSLEPHAIATGITEFFAVYQPGNVAVADLLSALGYGDAILIDGLIRTSKTLR